MPLFGQYAAPRYPIPASPSWQSNHQNTDYEVKTRSQDGPAQASTLISHLPKPHTTSYTPFYQHPLPPRPAYDGLQRSQPARQRARGPYDYQRYGEGYGQEIYEQRAHHNSQSRGSFGIAGFNNTYGAWQQPVQSTQQTQAQEYGGQWYAPSYSDSAARASGYWNYWHPTPAQQQHSLLTRPVRHEQPQPQSFKTRTSRFNAQAPSFTPTNEANFEKTTTLSRLPAAGKKAEANRQAQLQKIGSLLATDPQSTSTSTSPALERQARSRQQKRLHLMARPTPTQAYMQTASNPSSTLPTPRPLLVILDLNGTLLVRQKIGGNNPFIARPHVKEFLEYLFANHVVMVWSSSQPRNVDSVLKNLLTSEQRAMLVAEWGRDKLNLTPEMYKQKVQVYKQLSWVWSDLAVSGKMPWGQWDTVLIDDSAEKAASEPFNMIELEEFEAKPEQMMTDVLDQVREYLENLKWERNVSSYIKRQPFKYDPKQDPAFLQAQSASLQSGVGAV